MVVRAQGDTRSVVSALDPQVMVTVPENEDLRPIADDAGQRIRAALDTLNGSGPEAESGTTVCDIRPTPATSVGGAAQDAPGNDPR